MKTGRKRKKAGGLSATGPMEGAEGGEEFHDRRGYHIKKQEKSKKKPIVSKEGGRGTERTAYRRERTKGGWKT